jgi:hypothetical protein
MKIEQTNNLIKVPNRIIQRFVIAVVSAVKINLQVIETPSAVENVENKHHACVRTSSSQRLKGDQSKSVHVWRKIIHVRPSQSSQRVSNEFSLHTS